VSRFEVFVWLVIIYLAVRDTLVPK